MVGVNGARISNLNPPTLAAVTFGVAQVGLALLLRPALDRYAPPARLGAVALANLSAMTLFLWHQSAFLAVTMAGSLIGRIPGLLTPPAGTWWIAERLAWLPAFAAALAIAWLIFHRAERSRRRPRNPARRGRAAGEGRTAGCPISRTRLPGGRDSAGAGPQPASPDGQPADLSRSTRPSCSSHSSSGRCAPKRSKCAGISAASSPPGLRVHA